MDADTPSDGPLAEVKTTSPSVAILMCTKDGAAFIGRQLQSIAEQSHTNWALFVSDDGSQDDTGEIVRRFAEGQRQTVSLRAGPQKGVCANFLSLAVDPQIDADYYAFCDQDDIWYRDKLARALAWFATVPGDVPAVYCGRTELISTEEEPLGWSQLFARRPTFQNALVQNLGGGNTMMFNRAAKKLVECAGLREVVVHDWWVYQLVSGAGGLVHYDPQPMLRYRQHSANLIGSNLSLSARLLRLRMVLDGRFRDWNDTNLDALQRLPDGILMPVNRETLRLFAGARSAPLPQRIYLLRRSGVYRQTLLGD